MYLMRGGTHRIRALKFKIGHWTAVWSPIFVEWHNSEIFAVPPKDLHGHYVNVRAFW